MRDTLTRIFSTEKVFLKDFFFALFMQGFLERHNNKTGFPVQALSDAELHQWSRQIKILQLK
jgi:hypothetical protein